MTAIHRTSTAKWPVLLAIMLVLAMLLSACGATPTATPIPPTATKPATAPTTAPVTAATATPVPAAPTSVPPTATKPAPAATAAPAAGSLLINGAGATFPYPLYSRWFYEYAFVNTALKFNYQSIGSGGGITQIKAKTVDFAGSDSILTDADYAAVAPAKLQMLPIVAGAVVPTYNVKEVTTTISLVFDSKTLSSIFLGTITKWNDPAIVALNPGVTLPAKDIVVVHRSDGSGTSFIFTSYLAAVSADWKSKVGAGSSVNWPVGLGGKGNEGVAGTVSQNDGSIGYVELAYAKQNKLAYAKLKNAAGTTVEATIAATQNAVADFASSMPDTLAVSIVNAPGKDSWPIAGYTYLIIYMDQQDCTKGKGVLDFIRWAVTDTASKFASELDYVPLSSNVRSTVLAKLDTVTCKGAPLK